MLVQDKFKNELKNRFPSNVELSFGKNLQSKVQADLYSVIPRGKKCSLWFTYYNNENVCFQVDIDGTRKPSNFYFKNVCFKDELAFGTILVGTLVKYKDTKTNKFLEFFVIENIKYYKGQDTSSLIFEDQLNLFNKFLENDVKNVINLPNFLNICLPIIKTSYNEAYQLSLQLYYNTYGISFWNLKDKRPVGDLANNKEFKKEPLQLANNDQTKFGTAVFKISSNLHFDSYSLFGLNNSNEEEYFGMANIPDYKTSVMMNKIFRDIKENENLDLLEESDDEEEFENVKEDKYVNLLKKVSMKCVYLPKFKAWKPLCIVDKNEKISKIPNIVIQENNKQLNNISQNKSKPYSSYKIKFNSFKKINDKIKQQILNSTNEIGR